MAQVSADPDELEAFLHALTECMQNMEETMNALRGALDATSSWNDEVRDRFAHDMLEPLQSAVKSNIEYAEELKPWLVSKIEDLRIYNS